MARETGTILDTGDAFPRMTFNLVDGKTLTFPPVGEERWSVLLFFRGYWCPLCNQQLADFEAAMDSFRMMNIEVVAASVDSLDEAREGAERLNVSFKVAYGVDAARISSETGAFYEPVKGHLQPSGFIIDPEGKVVNAIFSTGPRGRLLARECLTYFPRVLGG